MLPVTLSLLSDEPLHGYFLRLALANGIPSSTHFLRAAQVRPRLSYGEEQLGRIADTFGLEVALLARANPASNHVNPLLNLRFQRSERSPICPDCVAGSGALRQAWSHDLVTACVEHNRRLVDECPACAEPLKRDRQGLDLCETCGYDLLQAPREQPTSGELAFSALLASQGHPARQGLPGSLSVGPAPHTIAEFLQFVATHIQAGPKSLKPRKEPRPKCVEESRQLIERAWSVLGNWPVALHNFVLGRIRDGAGVGIHKRLGTWYGMLLKEFADEPFRFFGEAVNQVLANHFERYGARARSTVLHSADGEPIQWFSAAEAARLIGVAPDILGNLVVNQELPGQVRIEGANRFIAIHRDVVNRVIADRHGFLTATEARGRLNVSKVFFERLMQAGGVRRYDKSERPPLVAGEFRLVEVDQLIARLVAGVEPRLHSPAQIIGIQDISAKHGVSNARVCSVLQDILHGTIRPIGYVDGMSGLAGLQFDLADIEVRLREGDPDIRLSVDHLAQASGWKPGVIKRWIEGGLLESVQEQHGRARRDVVPLSALISFLLQYTPTAEVSKRLDTKTIYLLKTLQPARVQCVIPPQEAGGANRGLLLRIDDLVRGAQLRKPMVYPSDGQEVVDVDAT